VSRQTSGRTNKLANNRTLASAAGYSIATPIGTNPLAVYSYLNATIGSTFIARRAGT
jgi:hypothetical protein